MRVLILFLLLTAQSYADIKYLTRSINHEVDRRVDAIRLVDTREVQVQGKWRIQEIYCTQYASITYVYDAHDRVMLQVVRDNYHIMTSSLMKNLLSIIINKQWRYLGNNRYYCDGIIATYVSRLNSIYAATVPFAPPRDCVDINRDILGNALRECYNLRERYGFYRRHSVRYVRRNR